MSRQNADPQSRHHGRPNGSNVHRGAANRSHSASVSLNQTSYPFSPTGSRGDYPAESPSPTTFDSGPFSTAASEDSADPSIVAVRGSVPPSPILRGLRDARARRAGATTANGGGDNAANGEELRRDYFPSTTPAPVAEEAELVEAEAGAQDQVNALVDQGSDASDKQDGTTKSQVQTQDDAAAAEVDNGAKARSQRTVRTGRVIAIDLDDAFLAASAEDVESAQVVPGVINALKALHEMGHPVHLISRRSSDDLGKVAQWLSQLGLSIGIKEDDVVTAVWLVDGQAAFEEKGKNQSGMLAGGRKLMAVRAINASLYIDTRGGVPAINAARPKVSVLLVNNVAGEDGKAEAETKPEVRNAYGELLEENRVSGWDEVVPWVKEWDSSFNHVAPI